MKHLLTTTALGLILAVTPAVAQDKKPMDSMQSMQNQSTQPGTTAPLTEKSGSTDIQKKLDATAQTGDKSPAATSGSVEFVQNQGEGHWLASDLIGQQVVNAQNESVGDINDLLVDDSGTITAAVIGVGGFLGIGEKDVAISFDNLTITKGEKDTIKVTLNVTKEGLDTAPEFKSVDGMRAEKDSADRKQQVPASRDPATGPNAPRTQ